MPLPAAHQALLVGFRDDDRRRFSLATTQPGGIQIGYCCDCRHKVYGDTGSQKLLRERDAVLACMYCNDHYRYNERLSRQGMVIQV